VGGHKGAADRAAAERGGVHLPRHGPHALHGEGLHGHCHHPRQTLLEETPPALQVRTPPRGRGARQHQLPRRPCADSHVQ